MTRLAIGCSFVILFCVMGARAQDTLRFMTYNILNFSNSSTDRIDELRIVLSTADLDLVVMQEVIDQGAVNNILNQILQPMDPDWQAASFVNGPDTDNACFYLSSRLTLVAQRQIATQLRDFTEYEFSSAALGAEHFFMYSGHLKASTGSDNEQRRLEECQVLRGELNEHPAGTLFMMCGDFNLYSSFEPAYQHLLSLGDNPNGRLLDPINRPGQWNNGVSFAEIHTQSPRTASFGGGATGGMDDRFDFILSSAAWMDTAGAYVIPATYHTYGNDGLHFNQAVNDGTNQAVPDSVADALHGCADHLPVIVDVVLRGNGTPVAPLPPVVTSLNVMHAYPNPFNGQINLDITGSPLAGQVYVYDLLGRQVQAHAVAPSVGAQLLSLNFAGRASGSYYVVLQRDGLSVPLRVILQR